MGKCALCGEKIGLLGECKKCGLQNNLTRTKRDHYEFNFKQWGRIDFAKKGGLTAEEFAKKHKDIIDKTLSSKAAGAKKELEAKHEKQMNEAGYFKGRMCPFTQVKVGGTKAATLAFTGASMNEYVWTHSECMREYCAIWNAQKEECSIMTIAKKLK